MQKTCCPGNKTLAADPSTNNFTIISIEVSEKKLTFIQEQAQRSLADLFSDIGGYLSLLVGCSVITVCEFFELLIDLFVKIKNRFRKEREMEEQDIKPAIGDENV